MKTIAVVEDNPDNRLLVRVILDPFYQVVEYETGFAALDGLRQSLPDLVLLDVSLPGMDGTEVLRQIRNDEKLRGLPVLALTAHAMAGDRQRFVAAGFDDYISKPIVDETILLEAIRKRIPAEASPNSTVVKSSPELNSAALERLRRLGGDQFAMDMIDLFLSYGSQKLGDAMAALHNGKLEDVADAVHPIKSSAGNVGATKLQELCGMIERSAQEGKAELVTTQVNELERLFATAKPQLEAEKGKLGKAR
jgi:CheY-like chemotaxis protein/HPt (histidine-containing phosphotransfer) domain-containing protein